MIQYIKVLKDEPVIMQEIQELVPTILRIEIINGEMVFDVDRDLMPDEIDLLVRYQTQTLKIYKPPLPIKPPPPFVPPDPPPENEG